MATTKDLPTVFSEVAEFIPLVQKVSETCMGHIKTIQDTDSLQDLRPAVEGCTEKAAQLDKMFLHVIGASDAQQQYRMVAKGDRLEHVMEAILEHMTELATSSLFVDVAGTSVDELKEALRKVKGMADSLPNEESSYSFYNSGSGWMNVNTGTAPQNNNNGSGYQFNGPIHGFQPPK
ncbi:uncharacterized protein N7500_008994 [Penicillium coprophilum]|uniref:uncharacterized protein n=1 Tax=Penicillium coprophilum TaxID=36646 RepID=UPI0023875FB1|nr:uncharacterized protein N7500_008994 [Penicillium coprophilum]KAJ5159343.1 hypothetical protein N7500_008994 [Penicillium coprophilum]